MALEKTNQSIGVEHIPAHASTSRGHLFPLSFAATLAFALAERGFKDRRFTGTRSQAAMEFVENAFIDGHQDQATFLMSPSGASPFLEPQLFAELCRNHYLPF